MIYYKIRNLARDIYRIKSVCNNFFYHMVRFLRYSSWKENLSNDETRNYQHAMIYHGLEKSMSYVPRNPNSGWRNLYKILDINRKNKNKSLKFFAEKTSQKVATGFLNLEENIERSERENLSHQIIKTSARFHTSIGAVKKEKEYLERGKLQHPEDFFFSRFSIRQFKNEIVNNDIIKKAINLSLKTPSVCNRQEWHVYHTANPILKNKILNIQRGNKPFGEHIPNLLILTSDIRGFFSGDEIYQQWIDGGMHAMSVIYAFHALGIGSCPLNWSQSPKADRELRKIIEIHESHTINMMLAVGFPQNTNSVCASARRPINEIYTELKEAKK